MEWALQYEEQQSTTDNKSAELLSFYYKYGNFYFKHLGRIKKLGIIPKNFKKCDTPMCVECIYYKSTPKPWLGSDRNNSHKPLQVT